MNYENDFVIDEIIDLAIKGYPKGSWMYKPTNAGEENAWLPDYMEVDEDGKLKQNFAKLNKLKLNNLVSVPYDKAMIKKMINADKEWSELKIENRWALLGKLKGSVFDKVLGAINKYDKGDSQAKKD